MCALIAAIGCGGSNNVQCGDGTERQGNRCVSVADGGAAGSGGATSMPSDAGKKPTDGGLTCGDGTVAQKGKCVVVDAGSAMAMPPKKEVGAGCADSSECQTDFCLIADTLPGGLCTVLNCSMSNPCPVGSTCYAVNNSLSICMPYCDRESECRSSEDYHCQPLYTTALNICAPSCTITKACNAGTNCNATSGLCEIASCDTKNPGNACADNETCYKDTRGLSSKDGLCLVLCDPNAPDKTCMTNKGEVCQPLADDPANKGFCAPPVCTKTSECPAGALCQNSVCQPPALCDSNNPCSDTSTTCVSGKCLSKCPTDATTCADIHPDLVCATVLEEPACLPLGSFPGSACRPDASNACDSVAAGDNKVAMNCQQGKCLPDCSSGGQTTCTAIDANLVCAHGVFSTDTCLPKGAFPGGPCDADSQCAQNLNGNAAVDMACVKGTCLITCDENDKWPGYGDSLCALVDPSLTCATKAGAVCVRECGDNASCDSGFTCFDPGALPIHENACLPTGSFPGSTCRSGASACDSLSVGNQTADMVCVSGLCVVSCPANNDALCAAIDPSLVCSESAHNLCVPGCNNGNCGDGSSCLDPSGERACLPTGSFPSSPCRSDNSCDATVSGTATPLSCVSGTCVATCAGDDQSKCTDVSNTLTCSHSAGDLCVPACNNGACPSGFSCLDPGASGHENACLPTGTFPSSPCRSGNVCDAHLGGGSSGPSMACVSNECVVTCAGNDETANDALCNGVSAALTCSESGGHLCVFACDNGACPSGFSCLDPGGSGHENACLPNGTFPGSTCRPGPSDQCDAHLGGGSGPAMVCTTSNVCVVDCSVGGNEAADDALCGFVSAALTCSESAGHICVPACQSDECADGFSCLDPGDNTHENACLPNGTFPGSTCRAAPDACDPHLGGGNSGPALVCVAGVCTVDCNLGADEAVNDALCVTIRSTLTCSESAGHVCVPACAGGACPSAFSCLDQGGSGHENACLPNGTFPGLPCATGNACDAQLGGSGPPLECVNSLCVINCSGGGDEAADDALCSGVNAALTCSESVGHICVFACVSGACPSTFSCLDPGDNTHQNACLPDGSFPGSHCAGGTACIPGLTCTGGFCTP